MKKIMCFFALIMLGSGAFAQNISKDRAKEIFGDRLVLDNTAKFPFTEQDCRCRSGTWPVPISGLYYFVQARYSPNLDEANDTLSLSQTLAVLKILEKTGFPDTDGKMKPFRYFFMTKDRGLTNDSRKVVAYYEGESIILDLPNTAKSGVLEPGCLTYFIEDKDNQTFVSFAQLPKGVKVKKQYVDILTIIFIK